MVAEPVTVFFSYSHKDEELRDELATHLAMLKRQEIITAWHDREITAGTEWAGAIDDNLNVADIILLLISANFLASDYCFDIELKRAMERHEGRAARVIPIILKPVDWQGAPFGKLQALPKNALPITKWGDRDEAFLNVAQGIRRVAEEIAKLKASGQVAVPSSQPSTVSTTELTAAKNLTPVGNSLSERQRRRLEQERDSLQQQYDLIRTKLDRLRQAYSVETDPGIKMKLEYQIKETQTELDQVDRQLESIEQQLS
jgi:hypothetical protein